MPITLVMEPTYKCNFVCDFCSSFYNKALTDIDRTLLNNFLIKNKGVYDHIMVGGGEPLLLGPEYYEDAFNGIMGEVYIHFQSNGSMAYQHPTKWVNLLTNNNVKLNISFQYGSQRKINNTASFTEELFEKYQQTFKKYFGYYAAFTYIITSDNYDLSNIDKLANLVKKYKVPFEIDLIRADGLGKNCLVTPVHMAKVYNYILREHTDIIMFFKTFKYMLEDGNKHEYITLSAPGNLLYGGAIVGDINSNLLDVIKNINFEKPQEQNCLNCNNRKYCFQSTILNINSYSPEDKKEFCKEMNKLGLRVDKLKIKLKQMGLIC